MFSHSSFSFCCTLACLQQAEQIHPVLRMAGSSCVSPLPCPQSISRLPYLPPNGSAHSVSCASCTQGVTGHQGAVEKSRAVEKGRGCRLTPRRRNFSERSKFIDNSSTQRQIHLFYTAPVPVKSNQFDSDEEQPVYLHPGGLYLQKYLPKKEGKRQAKLTT